MSLTRALTAVPVQRRAPSATTTAVVRSLADRLAYAGLLEQQQRWLERALGVPIHQLRPEAAAEHADPFAAYAENGTTALLARVGATPAGVAAVIPLRGAPGTLELTRVYVAPSARGSGVGRSLVEAAISLARARSAERLVLETHEPTMGSAVRLYRGLGFEDRRPLGEVVHPGVLTLELELELELELAPALV
jgi:GNAT superfamily N-acetyltransferase